MAKHGQHSGTSVRARSIWSSSHSVGSSTAVHASSTVSTVRAVTSVRAMSTVHGTVHLCVENNGEEGEEKDRSEGEHTVSGIL
ncbi:hypothetical protein PFISCL1PPCAC_16504 [Pristionchus fissidentatus]|uniref:Uncharacterized protein n=1 Tax=Pristionchus fissidentatus TaxID=1538716 RepID=A0AAV5W049_9BILA|nr:hypothetical protein PFISCL1PPCAC_16504 [Pristionchus fissidentatus]